MSVETMAALEAAIAAHFTERTEGGLTTGWVLQVAGVTADDVENGEQTSYLREVPTGQASHLTLGLIDYSHTMFRNALITYEGDWPG